jgi:hypothetical protein
VGGATRGWAGLGAGRRGKGLRECAQSPVLWWPSVAAVVASRSPFCFLRVQARSLAERERWANQSKQAGQPEGVGLANWGTGQHPLPLPSWGIFLALPG